MSKGNQQKKMEDFISKKYAINQIEMYRDHTTFIDREWDKGYEAGMEDAIACIEQLTPMDKTQLEAVLETRCWIPTSKKLPPAKEYVSDVCKYYLVQDEYGDMMVARYDGCGWQPMYEFGYIEDKIIAYMELPDPYDVGSEDNE